MNQQQLKSVENSTISEPQEAGIRRITVVLWPDSDDLSTMSYALRFAQKYQSSLTALYIKPYPDMPMAHYGAVPQQYIDLLSDAADKQAAECRVRFTRQLSDADIEFSWKEQMGAVGVIAGQDIPAADFIIVGQPLRDNPGRPDGIINTLMLHAGRPAVVVPAAGYEGTIADRVMLAWDGRADVDRAVTQAANLGEHLERHGIAIEPMVPDPAGAEESDVIRSLAKTNRTDLLVVGAWGHSRVREYTLGGVTRSLLKDCEIPVLFSH